MYRLVRISPTDDKKRSHLLVVVLPVLPEDIEALLTPMTWVLITIMHLGPGVRELTLQTRQFVLLLYSNRNGSKSPPNERSQLQEQLQYEYLRSRLWRD